MHVYIYIYTYSSVEPQKTIFSYQFPQKQYCQPEKRPIVSTRDVAQRLQIECQYDNIYLLGPNNGIAIVLCCPSIHIGTLTGDCICYMTSNQISAKLQGSAASGSRGSHGTLGLAGGRVNSMRSQHCESTILLQIQIRSCFGIPFHDGTCNTADPTSPGCP